MTSTILHQFKQNQIIYQSSRSRIEQAVRDDGETIILKMAAAESDGVLDGRLVKESALLAELDHPNIISCHGVARHNGQLALILEHFDAQSLQHHLQSRVFALEEALYIGLEILQGLHYLHQQKIVHKDLNPGNILFNPELRVVKIADLGIATKVLGESPRLLSPKELEGTIKYIAPEQTGRINGTIDHRTDFYGFGLILYQSLTGQLPFSGSDGADLIYAHLAVTPTPCHQISNHIPEVLSAIVDKLLAKESCNRYQSSAVLMLDLQRIYQAVTQGEDVPSFQIAANDFNHELKFTGRLYGRDEEILHLQAEFSRVTAGERRVTLLKGYSGIGKTALIRELFAQLTRSRGRFIEGKFDQLTRNTPYLPFVQAFGSLLRQLLTESESELEHWRDRFAEALENNAALLCDSFPELELILGEVPNNHEVQSSELQQRFLYAMQNFVRSFATEESPFLLFLDDLQWADLASLKLLEALIHDPKLSYLHIIGAYRSNEVNATHPLTSLIEKNSTAIEVIPLKGLDINAVSAMLGDTLLMQGKGVYDLAAVCHEKTQGNPFFIEQFLAMLFQDGLLSFNAKEHIWQWNIKDISNISVSDNVVELVLKKIRKLPEVEQKLLSRAALIGNSFSFQVLQTVSELDFSHCIQHLEQLMIAGLLSSKDEKYRDIHHDNSADAQFSFPHDRIQQAAAVLLDENSKQKVQLKIARQLYPRYLQGDETLLFTIADHYSQAPALISKPEERLAVIKLLLHAANNAKRSASYNVAKHYLIVAIELLDDSAWQDNYKLTLNLKNEAADCLMLMGEYGAMQEMVADIRSHAKTPFDCSRSYEVTIQRKIAEFDLKGAIDEGLEVLELLNKPLPRRPNKLHVLKAFIGDFFLFRKYPPESLHLLPKLASPEIEQEIRLLALIGMPAYIMNPNLLIILVIRVLRISVLHGNIPYSVFAYAARGLIYAGIGATKIAERFGHAAMNLISAWDAEEIRCRTQSITYFIVKQWSTPFAKLERPLLEAYHSGRAHGDQEFSALSLLFINYIRYLRSNDLDKSNEEFEQTKEQAREMGQRAVYHLTSLVGTDCQIMQGKQKPEVVEHLPELYVGVAAFEAFFYRNKLLIGNLFRINQMAYKAIWPALTRIDALHGLYIVVEVFFYSGLALINRCHNKGYFYRLWGRVMSKPSLWLLSYWSKRAPEQNNHKYLLLEAERRWLLQKRNAIDYYNRAIDQAIASGFYIEAAFAAELVGERLSHSGNDRLSKPYIIEAWQGWKRLKAFAKVEQIEQCYPWLSESGSVTTSHNINQTTTHYNDQTSTIIGAELDLHSILQAAEVIASEIKFSSLIKRLLALVVETAGAQNGCLLLREGERWVISASSQLVGNQQQFALHDPSFDYAHGRLNDQWHPVKSIIRYIIRTSKPLLIDDISENDIFQQDTEYSYRTIKSVLGIPLSNQGQLTAIVYLENNLTSGSFTESRYNLLKTLAAQMAISIDNAKLYTDLESKVKERTAELEYKNRQIVEGMRYAQNIQLALLPQIDPPPSSIKEWFIWWEPKEIVGGDFYYSFEDERYTCIAVIDCTGHGVSGAFMTILAHETLEHLLKDLLLRKPDQIINGLNDAIYQRVNYNRGRFEIKDGMELSLVMIDREQSMLRYCGAGHSLFLYHDGQIQIVKGNKWGVGDNLKKRQFKVQDLPINEKDRYYLFSDGIVDQFGGKDGHPFERKRVFEFLQKQHDLPFKQQKDLFRERLEQWQGKYERIDDIVMCGFSLDVLNEPPSP